MKHQQQLQLCVRQGGRVVRREGRGNGSLGLQLVTSWSVHYQQHGLVWA